MRVELLSAADAELAEAVEYYNHQRAGLGDEFLVELLVAIERIQRYPSAWPRLGERVRRYRMRRYPYGIIYQQRDDSILIVAVAHLHRRPGYWANRV